MLRRLALGLLAALIATAAHAQSFGVTAGGATVPGHALFCFTGATNADGSRAVIPCQNTTGAAGFPAGATPITGVFSGADTTTAAATLAAGGAGKFTYICGFSISGLGATAATTVSPTVATVAGGNTLTYQYIFPLGAGVASTPVSFTYNPCIPASAANNAVTVTVPGAAGNTSTQINAWGFQQ